MLLIWPASDTSYEKWERRPEMQGSLAAGKVAARLSFLQAGGPVDLTLPDRGRTASRAPLWDWRRDVFANQLM